jgi:hypothetical protein
MIRLLIVLLLLSNSVIAAWHLEVVDKAQLSNLTVSITGDYKVEVYKERKHKFSFDCSQYLNCRLFITNEETPKYDYLDGLVQPSETVLKLSIDNINQMVFNSDDQSISYIAFVVSEASEMGAWGQTTHYQIDIDTGGLLINKREWDWLQFGMPKP